jgi:hypothetical protein
MRSIMDGIRHVRNVGCCCCCRAGGGASEGGLQVHGSCVEAAFPGPEAAPFRQGLVSADNLSPMSYHELLCTCSSSSLWRERPSIECLRLASQGCK